MSEFSPIAPEELVESISSAGFSPLYIASVIGLLLIMCTASKLRSLLDETAKVAIQTCNEETKSSYKPLKKTRTKTRLRYNRSQSSDVIALEQRESGGSYQNNLQMVEERRFSQLWVLLRRCRAFVCRWKG